MPHVQEATASLEGPALALSLDRLDPRQVIASIAQGPPVLLDLRSGDSRPLLVVPTGTGWCLLRGRCQWALPVLTRPEEDNAAWCMLCCACIACTACCTACCRPVVR